MDQVLPQAMEDVGFQEIFCGQESSMPFVYRLYKDEARPITH
jgi:hypothetical protein